MANIFRRRDKIRRFAGILLLLAGTVLVGLSLYPLIWLGLHPPQRYSYAFIALDGKLYLAGMAALAAACIGFGSWLVRRSRPPGE